MITYEMFKVLCYGITVGLFIGFILNLWVIHSYKKILIMKSKDGTAEHIYGKFYYIREEGK